MNKVVSAAGAPGIGADLEGHLALCREVLELVEREGEALRQPGEFEGRDFAVRRASLLPRLEKSLGALRHAREAWLRLDPRVRSRQTDLDSLLRDNQNLIMKIIVLDRENEQALLRRGLLPPGHLPTSQSQRPHMVAARYAKNLPA
jgi:hypothetical protein